MQNHKQLVGFIAPQQLLVADFGSSQARSLLHKEAKAESEAIENSLQVAKGTFQFPKYDLEGLVN